MGTISLEHGDHLYWLGRYTERAFTTLKAIQDFSDKLIDQDHVYQEFLSFFGITATYADNTDFIRSFIYDKDNINSVAHSLECAFDNGIVLREEISTEALSFLQLARDRLLKSSESKNIMFSLLPLKDILYGFWGCIADNIFDDEKINIIYCGKSVERLDLYMRLNYPFAEVDKEFVRLCKSLRNIPKNTPYRYNTKYLSDLVEIIGDELSYKKNVNKAISSLGHLFEAV